jgi:hypothetical protein
MSSILIWGIQIKTILITQTYDPKNKTREKELKIALNNNIHNKDIDQIILITDKTYKHPKIKTIKLDHRPQYSDLFTILNQENQTQQDHLLIAANSDIYFHPKSIQQIKQTITDNTAIILSRWDSTNNGLKHHNRWDSQDVWAVKNQFLPGDYNITLGLPGCDNRIAAELQKAGYKLSNPSLDIITIHYHREPHNTYSEQETLVGEYAFIHPHYM